MTSTQAGPRRPRWILVVAGVLAAFLAGYLFRGSGRERPAEPSVSSEHAEHAGKAEPAFWTCSMHPQIKLPEPGKCPICFMDLIPVEAGPGEEEGERTLVLTEAARKLARIRTVAVERRPATVEVRMVGKIDYDESRINFITSYVPGRLERMFVDFTGVRVQRGDHLVDIYSPELIGAQEELLQAIQARIALANSELEVMRRTAEQTVVAAREKLRLWGLLPEQIRAIEEGGASSELITIYSPMTGVVIEKHANQGMYVQTGSRIYTIADLNRLWVRLDAYESDMAWLHLGQQVEFTTEAYPGTVFRGRVSFIDPVLDPRTRTVKLRVNVANDDLRLKPEMLVRAAVKAQLAGAGRVFDPYLAGKWISPMHPEVVKEGPGSCDVCGMALVPAESLGFAGRAANGDVPLVIPATAPLITGKRAVVYVEKPGTDRPTYEGREVVLGPKAGDIYIVREGLAEGERVVVEGNFKIDSALQIQARPSMMSPEGGGPPPGHDHGTGATGGREPAPANAGAAQAGHAGHDHPKGGDGDSGVREREHGDGESGVRGTGHGDDVPQAFRTALSPLYRDYLELHTRLAEDDPDGARAALGALARSLASVTPDALPASLAPAWAGDAAKLDRSLLTAEGTGDLASLRVSFGPLSEAVIGIARRWGHGLDEPLNVAFCPMALEEGASWLQTGDGVRNPYYGAMMFRCGELTEKLAGSGADGR